MSYPVEEKGVIVQAESRDGEQILGRRHSQIEKGPGHIDVHEVDEKELDEAEDAIIAEQEFTPAEYSRVRWKIDLILMPVLMIIYGLQFADKTSLAAGVVFGLREDTKLVGNHYADLTTYFYIGYLVAQVPMGWVLQRFPLGRALSVCVIIWGGMVMLLGACNNYWQLSIVRVLLGWFESVVTPGFAVLTASWYLRREQTLRQSMYYTMNTLFGMIFGIGNYKIAEQQLKNGGLAPWRLINLFLGGVTVGMGIVCLVILGTPKEVWWLSKREKRMAHARIVSNATGGGEHHPWRWSQVIECFKDPQFYMAFLANLLCTIPNGAITTFNTLLMKSFGYSNLEAIIWLFPGYAVQSGVVLLAGTAVYFKPSLRFPIVFICQLISMFVFLFVGLAGKVPDKVGNNARFVVFCFVSLFAIPMFMMWPLMSINVAGRTKKTFNAAMLLVAYCVGNIIGSQVMRPKDAPLYLTGLTAIAIVMAVNVVNFAAWWYYYWSTNRKRERAFIASGITMERREHENRLAGETDLTDRENPHFRYLC
ncbi:hypothetical protein CC85DRAFT_271311 [Cutaneotrichosporon oleaginosum]|uniref:MFS general substrate transporter n=1 Tax=Cutaneotrichosporon oleaginosum TaxID=879819 RepID=A0A0J0XSX6_9TREE|nr:uncharacterized protein CC85DRAFT_271311 [Cutaneotrichosporon oleaginosum]KLT44177.1 hypothetical protein CC85DRAFT_271311 [Cutaneotrichosporon oleaginosum]TXT11653.1 hypothetical protein COLE_02063 [Cutaneotrichosporon oleaginosum]